MSWANLPYSPYFLVVNMKVVNFGSLNIHLKNKDNRCDLNILDLVIRI